MTISNYEGILPNQTIREITNMELYKNPSLVRDVREFGLSLKIPPAEWPSHMVELCWKPKRLVVDQFGNFSPPNLDFLLPPDYVIDAGKNDKGEYDQMIIDRFEQAFWHPVPSFSAPYFQRHTLKFWGVVSTVLAAAYPEAAHGWARRNVAANDNTCRGVIFPDPANDNDKDG